MPKSKGLGDSDEPVGRRTEAWGAASQGSAPARRRVLGHLPFTARRHFERGINLESAVG